jgi:hypothetical protein
MHCRRFEKFYTVVQIPALHHRNAVASSLLGRLEVSYGVEILILCYAQDRALNILNFFYLRFNNLPHHCCSIQSFLTVPPLSSIFFHPPKPYPSPLHPSYLSSPLSSILSCIENKQRELLEASSLRDEPTTSTAWWWTTLQESRKRYQTAPPP